MAQHSHKNFQQYYFLSENKPRKAYFCSKLTPKWLKCHESMYIVMYFMSCLSAPSRIGENIYPCTLSTSGARWHRPWVWEAPSRAPPKNVTIGFNFPLRVNSIFHACCKIFYSRKAGLIFIAKAAMSRKNSPSTSWACHDLPWPGLGVTH